MPKYEYACKSCGEHLEVLQSFAEDPLTDCPACGGALRKVFSPPSIAFKGSGFYRTDNRKRRSESSSESKAESSTDAKSDAKTDSKAEAKSGSKAESKADSKSDSKSEAKSEPARKDAGSSSDTKSKPAEAKTA